jgi:hypothetical protein
MSICSTVVPSSSALRVSLTGVSVISVYLHILRHPGLDPGSTFFAKERWMPDQVRHDDW